MNPNRRTFLTHAAAGLGALGWSSMTRMFAAAAETSRPQPPSGAETGLPRNWRTMRKFDAHNHVFLFGGRRSPSDWLDADNLVEAAEVLGIEKVFCSRPITGGVMANIDVVRESNNAVLGAMKRHPQRIAGYCFVQPGNGGIPFLGHSAFLTEPRALASQPKTSHALDFCALSKRYPELLLILGHINGGGDWEWEIKGLRECANVFVDTSGSVLEDDTIGLCVRALGHERVLFATDATMEGCVGKILSAELTAPQREDIFWRNFQRILDGRKG
jgi:hypothetical protein